MLTPRSAPLGAGSAFASLLAIRRTAAAPYTRGHMYVHQAQLRFSDTDAMGHVNHARFATLCEDARIAMLRTIAGHGADLPTSGLILAHLSIDYVRPLVLDDEPVAVRAWLARVGTSSFVVDYDITQRDQTCARASSVLVAYDYEAARSRPLSDHERRQLSVALDADVPG